MAKCSFLSLPILIIFLLHLFFNSGGVIKLADGQAPGQGAWCIAKPSASEQALMENINDACATVNCTAIEEGGPCFYPDTLLNHASFAMNLYYQQNRRHFDSCHFNDTGVIVVTDPSYGFCRFKYTKFE